MDLTKDKRFLNHLINCIPESAYNYRLSSYTIILEAWRRGLSVDYQLNIDKAGTLIPNFYISNKEKTHKFNISTGDTVRSEEHTSELQSRFDIVCRLLLEQKKIAVAPAIMNINDKTR